jgi:putative protein-disulfide isomerase
MKKRLMEIKQEELKTEDKSPETGARQQVEVVYYTDPLCCWSWAFEPQWRKLQYEFAGKLNIRYCMAGLIPDWKTFNDPVNNVSRPVQMGPIWMQAAHMSGMPIHSTVWINDPPASSYMACIAVKAAALQSAQASAVYLRAVREAMMLQGINISKASALLKVAELVAAEHPAVLDFNLFKQALADKTAKRAFEQDLAEVRIKNIGRCPALIFRYAKEPALLITGYRSYTALLNIMQQIAPNISKVQEANSPELYSRFWKTITEREIEVACGNGRNNKL